MRQFYLLFLSISFVSIGLMFNSNAIETTVLNFEKTPTPQKKPVPQKKRKPLVFKDSFSQNTYAENNISNLLVPTITATKTVTVQGGGNPVPGSQLNYQIIVSNTASVGVANNATGVTFTDNLVNDLTLVAGSVKATPIAVDDAHTAIGNVGLTVNAANGILANDISPDNTTLSTPAGTFTGSASGTFVIAANGSFTYINNPGYTGTETYTYTLNSSNGTSTTGTITVTVNNTIWFVNTAYAGGSNNGTLARPFTTVNAFQAINDAANTNKGENGDFIFVHAGTYSTSALTLRNSQKLIGQDATSSIASITGITVPTNSNALPATSGSTVTIANTTATPITLGSGNEIQGCTVTSTSGTTMSGASVGALKVRTTILSASAGQALQITAGGALDVQFRSISAAGASKGISVNSSTGSFEVTGSGTTAGSGGTISNMTTRGAEFSSVSNITLKNMNFTNANTTAGSSSPTDYSTANGAITLNSVSGVTLTKIAISGTTRERGITGKTISNFTLNGGSTLTDCGDGVNEGCLYLQELTGTCNINDVTLTKGSENIARVFNSAGTLTLNIGTDATTTTFNDTQTQNVNMTTPGAISAIRSYCFIYSGSGNATATLNTRNTSFLKAGTHGFKVISDGTGTVNANIRACTFDNENTTFAPNDQGGCIEMTAFNTANLNYNILNNTCRGRDIAIINIVAQVNSNAQGRVNDNTVTHYRTGSAGEGIRFSAEGSSDITTEVLRNTVSGMAAGAGILATATGGDGKVNATITNNTITITDAAASHNIQVQAGNSSSTFSNTVCANVANNITSRPDLTVGFNFRVRAVTTGTHKLYLQGNGTPSGSESVWVNNGNTPALTTVVAEAGTYGTDIFSSSNASPPSLATCPTVNNPTYNSIASASVEEIIEKPTEENSASIAQTEIEEKFEEKSDETESSTESVNSDSKDAASRKMAGETVAVNGAGSGFSLPAGKSTTITFSATVSSTPSTCAITNQASVSGSNFTTVNSNTTTTNLIVAPPTAVTPSSATSVCTGTSLNLSATCPNGSVNWYTTAAPTTLLGNSASGANFSRSPTVNTTYQAACLVGGCESTKTNTALVTVNASPIPAPGSNSPVCEGSTLNLTSAASTSYFWSGPNSFTSTLRNPNISNVTIVAGNTYTITQTNSSNCTATATVAVIVNQPNNISLTSAGGTNAQNVVINTAITNITYATTGATGATFNGLPTGVTGTWLNNVVTISGTPSTATGSPFGYTVTLTGGCGTVTATGTIAVTIATIGSNSPVCEGKTLNLTSSGGSSYLWAGPSGFTSSSQNPTIANATSSAEGTYTVSVVNGSATTTLTTAVTINGLPILTEISSNSPLCAGQDLSVTLGEATSSYNYLWTGPGTFSSSNAEFNISNITTAATGTYNLLVTTLEGCTATDAIVITVNALPTATATPSTQTICSGGAITTIAITGTGTSYTWTRDNTTSATGIAASGSGNISGSLTNTTEAPITVTFTITPVGACNGTPITASVVVNPIPTVVASTPSQSICSGQFITGITFNNPPPSAQPIPDPSSDVIPPAPKPEKGIGFSSFVAGTVFNWTRDNTATVGGTIGASGSGNISGSLISTTALPVTVTFTVTPSYTNAGTTCTGTPITITVTVNPNPASITITDTGTSFCQGGNTTLSAPPDPNYTYVWQRSLSGIINPNSYTSFGGTAQTQVVSTSGNYRVIVTNQYNCSASDTAAIHFADFTFNGSLATGDAQQTGRMSRFGVVSTCASPKGYPGTFDTGGQRFYDSYTITNPTNVPVCATIGTKSGCGVNMFCAAYINSFNPANVESNYLADPGSSFPNTGFYEATIPANGTIVVVVHEVNTGIGCSNYTLTVELPREPLGITVTPNNSICAGTPVSLIASKANSYAWTGGGTFTTQTINPSPNVTTTYNVTLGYGNGTCNATATAQVVVNPVPTASSNSPLCAGGTLNLSSGTANSYSWTSPSGFTSSSQNPSIANVSASQGGVYTVVTVSGGCTSTATVNVVINALPTATASSNSPICAGVTLQLTGTGGGTYLWTAPGNGGTSAQVNPFIPNAQPSNSGTYTLRVTNGNGCSVTVSTVATVNARPTATASSNSPICAGTTLNLTGGGVGTSYMWTSSNGFTSTDQSPTISSATVSSSGTYRITVTNVNGCTSTASVAVTVNALPTATASSNSPVCAGNTLNLTGGGVGTYLWTSSNGFTSTAQSPSIPNATASSTGTYTLTVTNQDGCTASATTVVTVLSITLSPASQTNVSCNGGNNGAASINTPTGGAGGYTYNWTPGNPNGDGTVNVTGLTAGIWTCNVTDANGCTASQQFTITQPTAVSLTRPSETNTYCSNNPTIGTASVNAATGGVGGYTYDWTPGNPTGDGTTTITGLTAGIWTCTVTDANSCTASTTVTIVINPLPVPNPSSDSPKCEGQTLTFNSVAGMTSYAWAGPNEFSSSLQNPSISNVTTSATGTYTVTVTNANGCTASATTAVTVNANPTATASSNSPICAGTTLNLTGGGGGTYAWTSTTGFTSTEQNPTISNATISSTGTYTVTVTNAGGCTSTASVAVTVNANPTATASSNSPICAGNSISLTGGGVGTYLWAGPNGYSSTAQSPTIPNATILASGTYQITVTNVNGCTSTATTSVTVNPNPVATASNNSPICSGTTLNLTGGGVGTYAWTGPNGYTSSAQSPTISSPTVLASGVYIITVTNANNCTSTATTSVTVNPLPVVDAGATQTICEGSTASLTATCNLVTVSTTLSGASEVPANASTATGIVSGTFDKVTKQLLLTISFNGLSANASAAHIHKGAVGANGGVVIGFSGVPAATSGSFTYSGTLTAGQETDLLAGLYYVNVHNASFPGGEIRGQLSTACVANSYTWNPGNLSGQTITVSPIATQLYTVTASNTTTGCSSTATTTVNVNPRPVPTIGSNTPVCAGNTLNLTSGGGTSYAWAGPNTFTSTDQNPSIASVMVSATGTYTVTVTNVNGCTNTATTAVVINALPTATATNNSPICSGVTLQLTGGGVGTYLWNGPSGYTSTDQSPSIPSATASMSGTYTITVTNANGCTSTATTSVTVNPVVSPPTPQANTQIIFGASITLTATGCSGVNDVLKWYQSSDNALVTMPVSPTATTNYYAKCETTLNGITCISGNSVDVTVTVLQPLPPVATGATTCIGTPTTLTATGCSGGVGMFVLKWYQNSDDALVTMPVSPTTNTDYYARCEQTFNSVTAISAKSNVVTVTVLNPIAPVATGGTIYIGNSITLTATGCTGSGFVIKWYQTADNVEVTMPVSPTVATQYYAKCEQTANSVTCASVKSNDVTVTVVSRIFVDITKIAAPIQNGNSWATAYGNLQTGLSAAAAVVVSAPAEVWVAQGTYKPTATTTRTIYFNIPSGVKVYGGFAGTENDLNTRNFRTNTTILSGDIGTQNLFDDNSYHVVVFDGSSTATLLDGFTITGGYANFDPKRVGLAPSAPSSSTIETGGGITVQNAGMPMIANCTIVNNAAVTGGGVYAGDASLPKIVACKIISNQATFGAGIYFQDGSNGSMTNTLISGNRGVGTVYNNKSNTQITNCTIAGNGGYNGGIFNSESQPVVKNSIIWNNSTPFNDTQSIITYSTVQGGYAGTGNLSFDPKFVNPVPEGLSPNANGDYRLQASSLAIDRGDNAGISLTDVDLDGNLRRFNGGTVDMGAYEFQGNPTSNLVISAQTGDWEINSTWVGFKVPQLGDVVIIDSNHIVTINATATAKNIEYRGTGQIKLNNAAAKLNIGF
jgi:CHRD domain/Bacterial Ig domain/PKD-like domain/Ig-like domain CHU_C associated/CS domain